MNPAHLDLCDSDEWAEVIRDHIVPWVLDGIDLGDRAIEIGPGPGRTTDVLQHLVTDLTAVGGHHQRVRHPVSRNRPCLTVPTPGAKMGHGQDFPR